MAKESTRNAIVYTIGHSTRSIEEFAAILQGNGVSKLIDIRTVPRSRTNPQYNAERLAEELAPYAIDWRHMPGLGGLRKPKKDSINAGWRNESFRGYADYMQTEQFRTNLEELIAESEMHTVAIMCAEAVPWRCHRSLVADALLARGLEVRHIMSASKTDVAKLHTFAVIDQSDNVIYPSKA